MRVNQIYFECKFPPSIHHSLSLSLSQWISPFPLGFPLLIHSFIRGVLLVNVVLHLTTHQLPYSLIADAWRSTVQSGGASSQIGWESHRIPGTVVVCGVGRWLGNDRNGNNNNFCCNVHISNCIQFSRSYRLLVVRRTIPSVRFIYYRLIVRRLLSRYARYGRHTTVVV